MGVRFRVTGCIRCSWVLPGAECGGLKIRVSVVRFRPWLPLKIKVLVENDTDANFQYLLDSS